MPIGSNLNLGFAGSRFAAAAGAPGVSDLMRVTAPAPAPAPPAPPGIGGGLLGMIGGGAAPAAPPAPPPGQPILTAPAVALPGNFASIRPSILPDLHIDPSVLLPIRPFRPPQIASKTTTQLAQGAIAQLSNAAPGVVREAMNTAINNGVPEPRNLMSHLERFVRVGEVLNQLYANWLDTTKADFSKAFGNMDIAKGEVMDSIVSLAILNDGDLPQELLAENTPETGESDLQNRKVVWQSPPPGTPLQPPYVVLIAVEWSDVAKAQDIVKSITDQLVERDRFKLPRAAADRL